MWNQSLADDIADQFKRLEACGFPSLKLGYSFRSFKVRDRSSAGPTGWNAKYYERNREKKLALANARYRANRDTINATQKTRRMNNNIEEWKKSGQMICLGRELPTTAWREILLAPSNCDESNAQDDFIVFLKRCRGIADSKIATMLGVSVNHVWMVLSGRPQK